MDRSRGYNRRARKMLHILGGMFALLLPWAAGFSWGWWVVLGTSALAVNIAHWLKPSHAWWLRYISKPEDRHRHVISGLRGYALVILTLVVLWHPLAWIRDDAVSYVMFGWLALAWGDGLAGLVGPGPRHAPCVPWNKHKTWNGVIAGLCGTIVAYLVVFLVPWPGITPLALGLVAVVCIPISLATAFLESLNTPVDDNYLVGLGAPLMALLAHALLG